MKISTSGMLLAAVMLAVGCSMASSPHYETPVERDNRLKHDAYQK